MKTAMTSLARSIPSRVKRETLARLMDQQSGFHKTLEVGAVALPHIHA